VSTGLPAAASFGGGCCPQLWHLACMLPRTMSGAHAPVMASLAVPATPPCWRLLSAACAAAAAGPPTCPSHAAPPLPPPPAAWRRPPPRPVPCSACCPAPTRWMARWVCPG
jgi:hypothetical protein